MKWQLLFPVLGCCLFFQWNSPKKFFSRYIRSSMLGCGVMCLRVASTGRNISFFVGHTPNRLTQPKRSTPERTRIFLTLFFSSVAAFLLRIFPIRESIYLHLWLCLWRILMFVFFSLLHHFSYIIVLRFLLGSRWMGSTAVLYTCDSSLKLHGSSFTGLVNSNLMYCIITYISYEVSSYMFDIWNSWCFFSLLRILFYPCESFSLTLQHTQLPDW